MIQFKNPIPIPEGYGIYTIERIIHPEMRARGWYLWRGRFKTPTKDVYATTITKERWNHRWAAKQFIQQLVNHDPRQRSLQSHRGARHPPGH